jgi:hypothetical protein
VITITVPDLIIARLLLLGVVRAILVLVRLLHQVAAMESIIIRLHPILPHLVLKHIVLLSFQATKKKQKTKQKKTECLY